MSTVASAGLLIEQFVCPPPPPSLSCSCSCSSVSTASSDAVDELRNATGKYDSGQDEMAHEPAFRIGTGTEFKTEEFKDGDDDDADEMVKVVEMVPERNNMGSKNKFSLLPRIFGKKPTTAAATTPATTIAPNSRTMSSKAKKSKKQKPKSSHSRSGSVVNLNSNHDSSRKHTSDGFPIHTKHGPGPSPDEKNGEVESVVVPGIGALLGCSFKLFSRPRSNRSDRNHNQNRKCSCSQPLPTLYHVQQVLDDNLPLAMTTTVSQTAAAGGGGGGGGSGGFLGNVAAVNRGRCGGGILSMRARSESVEATRPDTVKGGETQVEPTTSATAAVEATTATFIAEPRLQEVDIPKPSTVGGAGSSDWWRPEHHGDGYNRHDSYGAKAYRKSANSKERKRGGKKQRWLHMRRADQAVVSGAGAGADGSGDGGGEWKLYNHPWGSAAGMLSDQHGYGEGGDKCPTGTGRLYGHGGSETIQIWSDDHAGPGIGIGTDQHHALLRGGSQHPAASSTALHGCTAASAGMVRSVFQYKHVATHCLLHIYLCTLAWLFLCLSSIRLCILIILFLWAPQTRWKTARQDP